MAEGNNQGNTESDPSPQLPFVKSGAFVPFWKSESLAKFLRERKLQSLAVILSGLSAWFALQNNLSQKAAAIPKVAVQTITLSPTRAGDFSNVTFRIDYRNIGGSAEGGTKVAIRVVSVGRPPAIAEGDDADRLLSGDTKFFEFSGKNIPGPFVALVACFTISDPRAEPAMFGFGFSKEMKMFHLDSRTWEIVQRLKPC